MFQWDTRKIDLSIRLIQRIQKIYTRFSQTAFVTKQVLFNGQKLEMRCNTRGECYRQVSGDPIGGATPVPIPNTEVKPSGADYTAFARRWETR
jgi:hypothetical protein